MPSRLVPDIKPAYSSGGCCTECLVEFGEIIILQQIQARNKIVRRQLKRGHVRSIDRLHIRQGDTQRVALLAVDLELVVRAAGQADMADHVVLRHALIAVQSLGKAQQMAIRSSEAALVADCDEIAIAALLAEG